MLLVKAFYGLLLSLKSSFFCLKSWHLNLKSLNFILGHIPNELSFPGEDEVDESGMTFFHGRLKIHVISAEDLPDTDTVFFNIDGKDFTDAYVTGDLGSARLFKTKYIPNELNPHWDEKFNVYVCHHATCLSLRVRTIESVG